MVDVSKYRKVYDCDSEHDIREFIHMRMDVPRECVHVDGNSVYIYDERIRSLRVERNKKGWYYIYQNRSIKKHRNEEKD